MFSRLIACIADYRPPGVFPEKLGRGMRPTSQTLDLFMTKIYDFCSVFMKRPKIGYTANYDYYSWHSCPKHDL